MSIFFGSLIHGIGDFSIVFGFLRGEVSDFWMTFSIPVAYFHYKKIENRSVIHKAIGLSFAIIVFTGIVSIFTPYRLGKWISMGFAYPEGERLQHFAGVIGGHFTYLPIGLMNTHLTYGGILGMGYLGFVFYCLHRFFDFSPIRKIIIFLALFISTFVVFYNQSRSIWIGCIFTLSIYIASIFVFKIYTFFHHRFYESHKLHILSEGNQNLPKAIEPPTQINFWKKRWAQILIGIVFLASIVVMMNLAWSKNWLIQRALQDSLTQKTTENQRYFIWKNSIQVLKSNWILGVGNANFRKIHTIESNQMIKEHEELWYELFITPRGHAHHDFMHFFIVGGILTAIIWIFFWSLLWTYFYASIKTYTQSFSWGVLVLFAAGFFQCYQLDDEVVLPFYALVGIFIGGRQIFRPWHFIAGFITTILFLVMSIGYWTYRSSEDPAQIHLRKITYQNQENIQLNKNPGSIYLEGCLSHYFGDPPKNRDIAMSIGIFIEKNQIHSPKKATITLYDRDSFDQDQLYKAHSKTPIVTKYFSLEQGENWFDFPESVVKEKSEEFPGQVRFRDFEIIFDDGDLNQKLELPILYLSPLCEKVKSM
ncbi:O-antigen ligase family protein [Leptospira sp. GIMC2001]|uniref:O-antigen ligase family protein n=1 Tax=Leptospira sp. GIMC2001 TaxID=1513297 RepID=UPI00234BB805|nr:O-antigen ligase family protein [Leptospira sp. GIMC2001]WCL47880.1 O-antigen ligase family protein [Leptospira sp. GIMC2001]